MNDFLMKKRAPVSVFLLAIAVTASMFSFSANAATSIATTRNVTGGPIQTVYSLGVPVNTAVQPSSWYNPGFGNAGWTHFSKWGRVSLMRNRTYKITLTSSNPAMHPGVTVWERKTGKKYASSDWFTGHSYIQYDSIKATNQIDESTGKNLGTIEMDLVANGFDIDGMQGTPCATAMCWWPSNPSFKPIADGVPGQVVVEFKAPKRGLYQFVFGGINPNGDKSTTLTGGFNNNSNYVPISAKIELIR